MNSRCFCWFPAAILVHQFGTPVDLRLGKIVYILVFNNISFSWLLPLDGFQFIFWLRDSENDLYLAANFGFFELGTITRSQSKVEVGTFYPFKVKVGSKYTYILLEALVWSNNCLLVCASFVVRNLCLGTYRRYPFSDYRYLIFLVLCTIRVKSFVTVYC